MGNWMSSVKEPEFEMVRPMAAPQQATEHQASQERGPQANNPRLKNYHRSFPQQNKPGKNLSKRPQLLPSPQFFSNKQVIVMCRQPGGKQTREYRFKREEISRVSAHMHELCGRQDIFDRDIYYVRMERLDNLFVHYERWVRIGKLPGLDVTADDSGDVLLLWISMYEMAREMEDWRMVAGINKKIIELVQIDAKGLFMRSVNSYMKEAEKEDELRRLLLDLHVAHFDMIKRYFWKLSPRVSAEIVHRKMVGEPNDVGQMDLACSYHQHDQLFKKEDCDSG